MSVSTYYPRRGKAINPATKKLVQYGLVGLAIAAILVGGLQLRPSSVLPSTGHLQIALSEDSAGTIFMNPPSNGGCHGNCNATSLLVRVSSIEIHTSGIDNMTGEWTAVCTDKVPMTIDLLHLTSLSQVICGANIHPDSITNVRLAVTSANATFANMPGTKSLSIPSDKLEIPISPIANVEAGKTTTVVVDIQPHILCTKNGTGECKLTPVLHAIPEGPD